MPAFLVHGVPDTHHLWDGVRSHLSRQDIIAPDLPGFGSPTPAGWTATKEAYLDWLIAEIEKIGEPVDIVGHDWGALLTERLVAVRPDLVRTWAAGAAAIHEDYVWHDMARSWQTPGVGETVMQAMVGPALVAGLTAGGVPAEHAETSVPRIDDTMKDSILKLYRSAVDVGKEWGPDVEKMPAGGLLIWGADDPYMQVDFAKKMAERASAELFVLEGTGHWWPLEKPQEVAAALEKHWA